MVKEIILDSGFHFTSSNNGAACFRMYYVILNRRKGVIVGHEPIAYYN